MAGLLPGPYPMSLPKCRSTHTQSSNLDVYIGCIVCRTVSLLEELSYNAEDAIGVSKQKQKCWMPKISEQHLEPAEPARLMKALSNHRT